MLPNMKSVTLLNILAGNLISLVGVTIWSLEKH